MIDRHTTIYLKDLKPVKLCGNVLAYEATASVYEVPFIVNPTNGEHDFNKCDSCKKNIEILIEKFTEKFNGGLGGQRFPNCCEWHSKLNAFDHFDIRFFISGPQMAAHKVIYTKQHIINHYKNTNWKKEIFDYIDFIVESFGQMPTGCGQVLFLSDYFDVVANLLNQNKDIPKTKKTAILKYLKSFEKPSGSTATDMSVLTETYEKWLKIFPFELNAYFGGLKQRFETQMPFLNNIETNLYSGRTKAGMHSRTTLFDSLVRLTDTLLTQIDGSILLEKGIVSNADKMQVDLIIQERKQERKTGYQSANQNEDESYVIMIKKWLADEQQFWGKLAPLLNNPSLPDAMVPNNKMLTTEYLSKLDYEKYLRWLFTSEDVKRPEKKEHVKRLLERKEKTIAEYRKAIDQVFFKTKYWKQPTQEQKDNFIIWREDSCTEEKQFFAFRNESSPLPANELIEQIGIKIANTINELYLDLLVELIDGRVVGDYYRLGNLIGKLDYLREIHGVTIKDDKTTQPPTLVIKPINIAIFCRVLDDLNITKQGTMTVANYCEKICKAYNLDYSERVRINFGDSTHPTIKQLKNLENTIIRRLETDLANQLKQYIDSKELTKQNLYA